MHNAQLCYGYRRFSLVGALLNTIILLVGSIIILMQATPRLLNPQHSNAQGLAFLALVGIAVNGLAVLRLRGDKSENAKVIAWHMLEDVLGWVAVLVVSLVLLVADIYILDPILSILISIYILYNVLCKLRRTMALFLQAVPIEIEYGPNDCMLAA